MVSNPITLGNAREPWLTAWVLVDLKKAESPVEAGLAALEGEKEVRLWSTGFFTMVELLATPPPAATTPWASTPLADSGGRAWALGRRPPATGFATRTEGKGERARLKRVRM